MHLIKAARAYRLTLPNSSVTLEDHLAERRYAEIQPTDFSRAGFTAPSELFSNDLVVPFEDGYAFAVRYDEKIVPASVTTAETKRRVAEIEEQEDRRIGRKERQLIRETVFQNLVLRALVRTSMVLCFYRPQDNLLLVATGSEKLANITTNLLVQAVGSIKATTIYVSSAKHGLTTRLASYLDGQDEAFDEFEVCGTVRLKDAAKRRISLVRDELMAASQGLTAALEEGAMVEEIGLSHGCTFRLTADFVLKGIKFDDEDGSEPSNPDDAQCVWRHEAGVQAHLVTTAVNALCRLLEYKEPEVEASDEPADESFL